MKSPARTHHSRIQPRTVSIKQREYDYALTVTFTFDPWDSPAVMPVSYAGDAMRAFQLVWDTGIDALYARELTQDTLDNYDPYAKDNRS